MQETGRAGRDGLPASACMLYGHPGRYVSDSMRYYGKNESVCRRKILYDKFLFSELFHQTKKGCACCDICSLVCQCDSCNAI